MQRFDETGQGDVIKLTDKNLQSKQISLNTSSFAGADLVEKPFELVGTASSLLEKASDPVEKSGDPVEKPADPMG
jgi:hypothetical protein